MEFEMLMHTLVFMCVLTYEQCEDIYEYELPINKMYFKY